MRFSIVITTFQRRHIVCRAIDSALAFAAARGGDTEVIVVDDASMDGTSGMIRSTYAEEPLSSSDQQRKASTVFGTSVILARASRTFNVTTGIR